MMCFRSVSRPGFSGRLSAIHFCRDCPPRQLTVVNPRISDFTPQRSSTVPRISAHIAAIAIGQPRIEPGPILAHGCDLSVFFFNEINRARPQVHSLLLRVMSERSVSAFNTEYRFPHLQVFADRNRVEKEETFELPGAARDRFLMELEIAPESSETVHRQLTFDTRYHDTDTLIGEVRESVVDYRTIEEIACAIQRSVRAGEAVQQFVERAERRTAKSRSSSCLANAFAATTRSRTSSSRCGTSSVE